MKRCGFISVIGAPNAGKSTLVNALVGQKISIVTHKVQTTRARIRGVAVDGDVQMVFIDTPGIFAPRRALDRAMVSAAWESLEGVDAILFVIDAESQIKGGGEKGGGAHRRAAADADAIIAALGDRGLKPILVLNKIDRVARLELLGLIAALNEGGRFDETFLIAASRTDGVGDLKAHLEARMPEGPWMYPEDQLSDISDRLMAAEITREKLYTRLHDELPYESTVETTAWTRTKKGELRIEQTIYVTREGHKPIALGKGGQTLKAIGEAARAELTQLLGEPVHLFLHVDVRAGWTEEGARLRAMGLDIGD